ncbi:tyrosine-type recombinase/integrase [Nonomuraea sp. WAC 01424]|uniref:tyrosine-type recombinase/integrase n=2 Tax=Nonomuraea TaxID=83681 RepID=UPI0037C6C1BB
MDQWSAAAAATWNRHLSALTSFTTWAQRQELLATNPARRLERRKTAHRGDRSIPRTRLERLFTDPAHALREKVLWRLLYDTAARAEEILTLNVEDLDLEFRRARVVSKGGAIEYVHWARPTVLSARRVPVQERLRKARPAPARVDLAPAPPFGAPASRPSRPNSARTAGQEPPPAPGQPRPLRTPRRRDLRPPHRRSRPRPTSPNPLTLDQPHLAGDGRAYRRTR